MNSLNNYLQFTVSKSHLKKPFTALTGVKAHPKIVLQKEKIWIIVSSIFIGFLSLGIGGIAAFYGLSAYYKIRYFKQLSHSFSNEPCITYQLSGGRFGDNIMVFYKTLWLSLKYNLKLQNKPFPYAEDLNLNQNNSLFSDFQKFKTALLIDTEKDFKEFEKAKEKSSIQFTLTPFGFMPKDWELDSYFRQKARQTVSLKKPISSYTLPSDGISIALHVRKGGTFSKDNNRVKKQMPTKFPPDEFYLEGIQKMLEKFPNQKMYLHLFTDHPNPNEIAKAYRLKLNNENIQFIFRENKNSHDSNVLDDFFNMSQCHALIRPDSGLSNGAEIIGFHQYVYKPQGWGISHHANGKVHVPGQLLDRRTL